MINVSRDKSIHVELLSNSRHPKMFVTSGDTGDNMRFSVWSIQWMQQTRARSLARDSGQFSQWLCSRQKSSRGPERASERPDSWLHRGPGQYAWSIECMIKKHVWRYK